MATIFICKKCKKETLEKVEACPDCGANIWEFGRIRTTFDNENVKKGNGDRILGIMIIVLCIILYLFLPRNESSPSPERIKNTPKESHSSIEAVQVCREYVRKELRSPRTAKFRSLFDTDSYTTDLGGGRYRIITYVDAQNAFGAEIRTQFICTVKYEGELNWRLEYLYLDM